MKKIFLTICIIAALTGYVVFLKITKQSNTQSPGTVSSTTNSPLSSSPAAIQYKDGTYIAEGVYVTPHGNQQIKVQLSLYHDVISDSIVTLEATDEESSQYQSDFIANYKQYVTGKKISDLQLTKVSMSSLTPIGFMNAVQSIESQAKI